MMGLFCYFQPTMSLPTTQEKALSDTVTQLANTAVLHAVQAKRAGKRKAYIVFTAKQRATIRKYASEHNNKDTRHLTAKNT